MPAGWVLLAVFIPRRRNCRGGTKLWWARTSDFFGRFIAARFFFFYALSFLFLVCRSEISVSTRAGFVGQVSERGDEVCKCFASDFQFS